MHRVSQSGAAGQSTVLIVVAADQFGVYVAVQLVVSLPSAPSAGPALPAADAAVGATEHADWRRRTSVHSLQQTVSMQFDSVTSAGLYVRSSGLDPFEHTYNTANMHNVLHSVTCRLYADTSRRVSQHGSIMIGALQQTAAPGAGPAVIRTGWPTRCWWQRLELACEPVTGSGEPALPCVALLLAG